MSPQAIGALLLSLREARGLSQRAVARKAGLSHTAIQNAEAGHKTSDDAFISIAKALGHNYHVARALAPAGVDVVPVLLPREEALLRDRLTARGSDVQEIMLRLVAAVADLDPYHRRLLMHQAELLLASYDSARRVSQDNT